MRVGLLSTLNIMQQCTRPYGLKGIGEIPKSFGSKIHNLPENWRVNVAYGWWTTGEFQSLKLRDLREGWRDIINRDVTA